MISFLPSKWQKTFSEWVAKEAGRAGYLARFATPAKKMFVLNAHPPIHPFGVLCVRESVTCITSDISRYRLRLWQDYLYQARGLIRKGHKVSTITRTTRREAKEALDTYVSLFLSNQADSVTPQTIDTIVLALTDENDLQLRDYLMGLPIDYSIEDSIQAVEILTTFLPEGNKRSLYCVLSAYHYEAENLKVSSDYLSKALDEDNSYSLAGLLTRVYSAGWPVNAFAQMRNDLHPKVSAGMDETPIPSEE